VNPSGELRREVERLRAEWEARGRSESRDFYVASHPGWQDANRRAAQARRDITTLCHGLELRLPALHVLEIGCGVGRLARPLAARSLSYTGVDIAPAMIEHARQRCAGLGSARFFECDGLTVPAAALDRRYGLVVAHAVFMHCPREVIAAWLAAAWAALAAGGELRFTLRADAADPGGYVAPPSAALRGELDAQVAQAAELPEELELVNQPGWLGHAFGWEEAQDFLRQALAGPFELHRLDPVNFGVQVKRPE
jgi:SAM-dependent methyltransferase